MRRLTVLGSTGSVGVSTLDVVSRNPGLFKIHALTAHHSVELLARQCAAFTPDIAVVDGREDAMRLRSLLAELGCPTRVVFGEEALTDVAASDGADTVMAAISGAAALSPVMAAVAAGRRILLANKESLVMAGTLFIRAAEESGADVIPVDSEHNAVFQALPTARFPWQAAKGVSRLILTASGGPFLRRDASTFDRISPSEALSHPNWSMGPKITVDSATMMNKGLEVIEAHHLFGVGLEKIEVLVHPQSIIHAMVGFADSATVAVMNAPDMKVPIAHALGYPDRIASGVQDIDFASMAGMTFERPDTKRFPCLALACEAARIPGAAAVLNGANEVAVSAFLSGIISFPKIAEVIERTLDAVEAKAPGALADVLEADRLAREAAKRFTVSAGS